MSVRCFLLEPVDLYEQSLRRYKVGSADDTCPTQGWHRARVIIGRVPLAEISWKYKDGAPLSGHADHMLADPRWPTHCSCGHAFTDEDHKLFDQDQLWKRSDTGEIIHLRDAPPGAMWIQTWLDDDRGEYTGVDGRSIVVRLPDGHDWCIDSVARNCDSPCRTCGVPRHAHYQDKKSCERYIDAKPHKCWNRVGEPPNLTVGKGPGPSCGAGGGSIATSGYHGFLRNGELTDDVDRKRRAQPNPAGPSPYVRISDILKKADGLSAAGIAEAYQRETGKPLQKSDLDFALKKGTTKGTFIEIGGLYRRA